MTRLEAATAARLAAKIGPDAVRGPVLAAYDALIVAREIHRRGIGLPEGTEDFIAGCLRCRSGRLTAEMAGDLIVLAVDYCVKRITV